jgi:hypothetical protein
VQIIVQRHFMKAAALFAGAAAAAMDGLDGWADSARRFCRPAVRKRGPSLAEMPEKHFYNKDFGSERSCSVSAPVARK